MKVNWFNLVDKVKELFVKVEDLEEQGDDGALAGITLPTSDPGDGVTIWNDNGTLKVSVNSGD